MRVHATSKLMEPWRSCYVTTSECDWFTLARYAAKRPSLAELWLFPTSPGIALTVTLVHDFIALR
jgi:hypothetical protein